MNVEDYSKEFLEKAVAFYLKLLDGTLYEEIKEEIECQQQMTLNKERFAFMVN